MGITTLSTTLARQINAGYSTLDLFGYMTVIYAGGSNDWSRPSLVLYLSYTNSFDIALIGAAGVVLIGACCFRVG